MFLITYVYKNVRETNYSFHYQVVKSVESWIDKTQEYDDGQYILINLLPISKEQAEKWDGSLHGM